MVDRPLSHCADLVRRLDHDRWLTLLYAHPDDREPLAALYAFNQELARVRERVSEPMLGAIRLQWWRESVRGLRDGTVRRHPVIEALAPVVRERALPEAEFVALVDAREDDFQESGFARFADLLAYADATGGGLSRLAARICGIDADEALQAAVAVGRAWALTGLLRALGHEAAVRRTALPDEAFATLGVDKGRLFKGEFPDALRPVVVEMAAAAHAAIAEARAARKAVPPRARNVFLLATLAEDYLRRLEGAGNDPFRVPFARGALRRQTKLFWASLRRRY